MNEVDGFHFIAPVIFKNCIHMKLNKEWHLNHLMPKNATMDQRIQWHIEHAQNCQCRDIPEKVLAEIKKRKLKV